MTPEAATHEIVTALRSAGAWPSMKVERDIVRAQINDSIKRLLKSQVEIYRRERARLEGHVDRLKAQLAKEATQ